MEILCGKILGVAIGFAIGFFVCEWINLYRDN